MSELIQKNDNRAAVRWKLLTGVSALALTGYVSSASLVHAEDSNRPQVWIELGGQLNRLDDGQEAFAPEFPNSPPRPSTFSPSQKFEYPTRLGLDEYGAISIQSEASDWIFSASVRYGRSGTSRHVHQQTNPKAHKFHYSVTLYNPPHVGTQSWQPSAARFADTDVQKNGETHAVLDFQAGKDVGLGFLGGKNGTSVINAGVRFAQFSSRSNVVIKSDPDWHFNYTYLPPSFLNLLHATNSKLVIGQPFHSNLASLQAERSFHGIGPSLSWNASAPIAGNVQDGELVADWGLNAALLFGRQRAKVHHQTTGRYHGANYPLGSRVITYHPAPVDATRSRSVTVPNVGAFAGLSFQFSAAKVSAGYRADFFFGAMDGGIDTRQTENVGFHGPYATISIGLP